MYIMKNSFFPCYTTAALGSMNSVLEFHYSLLILGSKEQLSQIPLRITQWFIIISYLEQTLTPLSFLLSVYYICIVHVGGPENTGRTKAHMVCLLMEIRVQVFQ